MPVVDIDAPFRGSLGPQNMLYRQSICHGLGATTQDRERRRWLGWTIGSSLGGGGGAGGRACLRHGERHREDVLERLEKLYHCDITRRQGHGIKKAVAWVSYEALKTRIENRDTGAISAPKHMITTGVSCGMLFASANYNELLLLIS